MSNLPLVAELDELELQLLKSHAKNLLGEHYHPLYEEDDDIFKQLVSADVNTERALNRYNDELARILVANFNWGQYEVQSAGIFDWVRKTIWQQQTRELKKVFATTLITAMVAGGEMTQTDLGIDIGWSGSSEPAVRFLDMYTGKLSKTINRTTQKRVLASIKHSISLGENTEEAATRLTKVIKDKKRSAMIAHTESVRAFSAGRLKVGVEVGADRKEWDATLNACKICTPLDHTVVKINEDFKSEFIGKITAPPAHPNCRCLVKLRMPEGGSRLRKKPSNTELLRDWF